MLHGFLAKARMYALRRKARRHWRPEEFAAFGHNSWIDPPAIVLSPHRISIGDDVQILARAWLSVVEQHAGRSYEPSLRIGDRARIGHDLLIACVGAVEIGPDVLVSDRVFIGDTYHDYRDPSVPIGNQSMREPKPVTIQRGAFLGVGAIILPGVTIGENAYVGAGSLVATDVPDRSVVVGNPARIIRRWDHAEGRWTQSSDPA